MSTQTQSRGISRATQGRRELAAKAMCEKQDDCAKQSAYYASEPSPKVASCLRQNSNTPSFPAQVLLILSAQIDGRNSFVAEKVYLIRPKRRKTASASPPSVNPHPLQQISNPPNDAQGMGKVNLPQHLTRQTHSVDIPETVLLLSRPVESLFSLGTWSAQYLNVLRWKARLGERPTTRHACWRATCVTTQ